MARLTGRASTDPRSMPPIQAETIEHIAERLLTKAANRSETLMTLGRGAFCILLLVRLVALERWFPTGSSPARLAYVVPLHMAAIPVYAWLLAGSIRSRLRRPHLLFSTAADSVMCFTTLLNTVIWPGTGYTGLLRLPDAAAFALAASVSALRLIPGAALLSGGLGLVGLAVLVGLDLRINEPQVTYGVIEISMIGLYTIAAAVAAGLISMVVRQLVRISGEEVAKTVRVRGSLRALLREHHDVRTLIGAARLWVDSIRSSGATPERLDFLERSLVDLAALGEGMTAKTMAEIASSDKVTRVSVGPLLHAAVDTARQHFPGIQIEISPNDEVLHVSVHGGERSLMHVLMNLLVNAGQGDGTRRATVVHVTVNKTQNGLQLDVDDDGPGFPSSISSSIPGEAGFTTKANGLGLGLALVAETIKSSGGRLELRNADGQGARVRVTLPLA